MLVGIHLAFNSPSLHYNGFHDVHEINSHGLFRLLETWCFNSQQFNVNVINPNQLLQGGGAAFNDSLNHKDLPYI